MKLAKLFVFKDQTVKSNTTQGLKDRNTQSLSTQAKKAEQLVAMMQLIRKALALLGDDIVELPTENEMLKVEISSNEEKWLEKSKSNTIRKKMIGKGQR